MNKNQQLLLEWLKAHTDLATYPTDAISRLSEDLVGEEWAAYGLLTIEEEFELLKAYAEWGSNHKWESN